MKSTKSPAPSAKTVPGSRAADALKGAKRGKPTMIAKNGSPLRGGQYVRASHGVQVKDNRSKLKR